MGGWGGVQCAAFEFKRERLFGSASIVCIATSLLILWLLRLAPCLPQGGMGWQVANSGNLISLATTVVTDSLLLA